LGRKIRGVVQKKLGGGDRSTGKGGGGERKSPWYNETGPETGKVIHGFSTKEKKKRKLHSPDEILTTSGKQHLRKKKND